MVIGFVEVVEGCLLVFLLVVFRLGCPCAHVQAWACHMVKGLQPATRGCNHHVYVDAAPQISHTNIQPDSANMRTPKALHATALGTLKSLAGRSFLNIQKGSALQRSPIHAISLHLHVGTLAFS